MVSSWAGRILPALVDGRKAAWYDGIPPREVLVVRFASALFLISCVALAGWKPEPASQSDGESLFRACQFKAAARKFEEALLASQNSARLHFWAGRSYVRLAEVASPLSTRRNARKAQIHLEAAVKLEPANRQYLAELFEFYLGSPEWFDGGLDRAAILLERIGPDDGGPATPGKRLTDAPRNEFRGAGWGIQKGVLRLGAVIGRPVPQKRLGRVFLAER